MGQHVQMELQHRGRESARSTKDVAQRRGCGGAGTLSPREQRLQALQRQAGSSPGVRETAQLVARVHGEGGMPANLQAGLEQLSGLDLSDVRVRYNSPKPAQLAAHAYAQGSEIHLAPGQEKHLPHEGWHVVQQRQGRVRPTTELGGTAINDDPGLEREADVMGARALTLQRVAWAHDGLSPVTASLRPTVQRVSDTVQQLAAALGVGLGVALAIYFLLPAALIPAIVAENFGAVATSLGAISGMTEWLLGYLFRWLKGSGDPRLPGYDLLLNRLYAALERDDRSLDNARALDDLIYRLYSEDLTQEGFSVRPEGTAWRDQIEDIEDELPENVELDWKEQPGSFVHFINEDVGGYGRGLKRRIAFNVAPDEAIAAMTIVGRDVVSQPWVDSAKIAWHPDQFENRLDPIVIYYYDDTGNRTTWIQDRLAGIRKRPQTPAGLTPLEPGLATAPQRGGSFGTRISDILVDEWLDQGLPSRAQFKAQSLAALAREGMFT